MERHKIAILLLCLCTICFFSGVQVQAKGTSKENFDENKVTIKLGALRITKKAIELRYEIRNGTEQDIWIFDHRENAKVFMDLKDQTLVVARRVNPPIQPGLMSRVFDWYDRLCAGQSHHEKFTAHLPIERFEFSERGHMTAMNQGIDTVTRLAFEIGYYTTEDLESLKKKKFGDSQYNISFKESGDRVLIRDVTQGRICLAERVVRLTLDGVSIPYKQWLHWDEIPTTIPFEPHMTHIEVLLDLFYSFSIGPEEYQIAQYLFGFNKDLLDKKCRQALDIYVQLAEGKFEPSGLNSRLNEIINSSDREKWLQELKKKKAAVDKKKQARVEQLLSTARHLDNREDGRKALSLLREILTIVPFCDEAFDLMRKISAYYQGQTITNSIGMKFAWIPAGEFLMGSEKDALKIRPHKVRISRGFWMGAQEVSQAQYNSIMDQNSDRLAKDVATAVGNVSWFDAKEFCRRLSQKEGKSYRLPSEAEWEYACRAGTNTDYWWGNDAELDVSGANPFGLYNMHDNVGEWCQDYFGYYYYIVSPELDPKGPKEIDVSEKIRVIRSRGKMDGRYTRDKKVTFYRRHCLKQNKSQENVGFRIVLDEN